MERHASGLDDSSRHDDKPPPSEAPAPDVSGVADQWVSAGQSAIANNRGSAPAGDAPVPSFHFPDDYRPPRRRVALPLFLFAATCLSTFFCGSLGTAILSPQPVVVEEASHPTATWAELVVQILSFLQHADWRSGLIYMAAVMGILLAHEMGHFLMTLRHHIPASLPFFIPLPLPPIGTMGAVIAMQGSRADRKQLFDIGLAGPLAGLAICVPVLIAGIYLAEPGPSAIQQPLLTKLLVPWIRPDLSARAMLPNPLLMAGWVGMLVTGLNMLPISQLDGGHVIYALFRRGAYFLAYTFFFAAIVWIVSMSGTQWILMLALVTLIGVEHPPTANDNVRLGPFRVVLGLLSLLIPALCFMPTPLVLGMAWLAR